MNRRMKVIFMALTLGTVPPAHAQYRENMIHIQLQESKSITRSVDECLADENCSIKDKLYLMSVMNDDVNEIIWGMDRTCMMMEYNNCVMPQWQKREEWNRLHSRMGSMMRSVESHTFAVEERDPEKSYVDDYVPDEYAEIEPATGYPPGMKKRRWWQLFRDNSGEE